MSNLLSTAKQVLIEGAQELFEERRNDIELTPADYVEHFGRLGKLIYQIDSYKTIGDILNDMESDSLSELGYFSEDQSTVELYLKAVIKSL